ncbi:ribosomal-protein-alanine N-acetyltransferase [Flavobacterium arsenatis]|uniref:Ribosomal-protein-alanine N-acetyltransferase n=1 Tax=Flavobacterium arsenatis TaxID=1484332 RepID=A0ABU1TP24_9FLAO|nr:GNAT family protein [Flavobacterium arsenatis]MDR6967646.1 ribosomal-protein-alanine N-acetyltransferase [Flavobacterium arsenatis]
MFNFTYNFLNMDQIEITTPRLLLKSITPQIINTLFKENTEAEIKEFFNADESGYNHLKNMHEGGMETHRLSLFYFLIYNKETNKIIGDCGFHTWNKSHRRAELFYNLKHDRDKRKGIMSEAVTKVLDFGFTTLELHRVEALTATWNIASIKLLERFKFTKEGTMREDYVVEGKNENSECFSLLKWEWEKNKV